MVSLVFSPIWFFGFDSVFDFISIIITLLIGFYSYKIYKLTGKKSYFYLYIVFLLLGLGLVLKSFANLGMYYDLLHKLGVIDTRLFGYQITALALFTYVLTTLLGYIILVALTLKLQGKRIISLLIIEKEKQMGKAANELQFELAAILRDEIKILKLKLLPSKKK